MNKICVTLLRQVSHDRWYFSGTSIAARAMSYQSDLALQKLYPNSRLTIFTPASPAAKTEKFNGYIPFKQLEITYSRSSGPGGQHVNCVNTKVDLRFKLAAADWIPEKTRQKLLKALENQITKDGYYVVKSDLTRSQQMNLADALEKLRTIIRHYEIETPPPSEDSVEKLRLRHEKAVRERLRVKRVRAQVKADRQGPTASEL